MQTLPKLRLVFALTFLALVSTRAADTPSTPPGKAETGLLFYLSGDRGATADFSAADSATPTYLAEVTPIADGARAGALQCGDRQLLAFRAPGNIYAQRGTLSFFWRSRYATGPTEFPIFRVGFADHSSWDMTWLRIDYNGHGFDAFVTDASLSRTRVSVPVRPFPGPKEWTHLVLSWDETRGIRFYVNGKLAAKVDTAIVLNVALDQFGSHSRIISPYQVQSDYNFVRGGDIDEVRIYDRMIDDGAVATLAKGDAPSISDSRVRSLADASTRDEWWMRYGFNRLADAPPALPGGAVVAIRKVEIHDAFDLKRWWWKATDGIRETTWPGVYNRSRLPGRYDYFTLPDWDCYFDSGKSVTFALPSEPWNHLEISGAAWGKMELLKAGGEIENASSATAEKTLFERPKAQEKTVHHLASALTGGQIRFTNVEQERPIGELSAYNVTAGAEPAGSMKLSYALQPTGADMTGLPPLQKLIAGRYAPDERSTLIAVAQNGTAPQQTTGPKRSLPFVHILVPNSWDKLTDGLDGIALDLPALKVKPTHGELFPLNIQVKDPLWPLRNLLDFTFSVKPGEARTVWLDLRDRILPAGKGFWLTIAGAGGDFNDEMLVGAKLRLIFKPRDAARAEHELDRFTQARDSYAMLVEEHPNSPKLDLWNRFKGDLDDLLRVNPEHVLGRQYAAAGANGPRPAFTQATPPSGVPLWAFRQTELLARVKKFVMFYVDHRQSAYGDFGGGISDDVDLTNTWPGVALMGVEPEKLKRSLNALLDSAYKTGMFTNGLPTLQADELHSYEEGINCLAQNLVLDYASPRQLERAMVTARGIETVTGVNAAGHRHFRSSYYSGTKIAEEDPWNWSKPYSNLVLQVPQLLVDYNGNPTAKKYLLELADGLLVHRHVDAGGRATTAVTIHFSDDREGATSRGTFPWHVFWGAWKWTGDQRYLAPLTDGGNTSLMQVNANALDLLGLRKSMTATGAGREHVAWQLDGDKSRLERLYGDQIAACAALEYINTEGSLWIDRVSVRYEEVQRARLGGVALLRNALYPGHTVSWNFGSPANDQSVAILVPDATTTSFKVIAYNLETAPVIATMTGWNIDPGQWEITQGTDTNNDDTADGDPVKRTEKFERAGALAFSFAPRATTVLTFKLKTPGTPYWSRPDLGLDREDVAQPANGSVRVRVHSLGSVSAPATTVALRDAAGRIIASASVPALNAPNDLVPKTTDVLIPLTAGVSLTGATVELDPDHRLEEITTRNNAVKL